jgi:D-lactate dehydrogenase
MAFTDVDEPWMRDFVNTRLGRTVQAVFFKEPAQDVARELRPFEVLSVFIKSKMDRDMLQALPKLKMIATRSTGYDHIDIEAARKKGIVVANVPTYGENTVAEHTFALILSLSRRLRKAYLKTLASDFSLDGLIGFDLKGRTLGVVGTGHIGLHVIRIGVAFGMKVLAYDAKEQDFLAEVLNFEYVPFKDLLKRSDIITLHVPYLPATRHMINDEAIRLVKKGAILINTARGGLVETDALIRALDQGILSGVGLDVLEEEELILEEKRLLGSADSREEWARLSTTLKNHVLLHRENVIYTPHMAFYSREAVERILETTAANVQAYLDGSTLYSI